LNGAEKLISSFPLLKEFCFVSIFLPEIILVENEERNKESSRYEPISKPIHNKPE
jgi:hypothetical protein